MIWNPFAEIGNWFYSAGSQGLKIGLSILPVGLIAILAVGSLIWIVGFVRRMLETKKTKAKHADPKAGLKKPVKGSKGKAR
jgi:cytoskeletal protein RodZ